MLAYNNLKNDGILVVTKGIITAHEMNKKRWTIRYFMLSSIGMILIIKIYFMLFIIDFTIGLYSFLTTLTLFIIFYYLLKI